MSTIATVTMARRAEPYVCRCHGFSASCTMGPDHAAKRAAAKFFSHWFGSAVDEREVELEELSATHSGTSVNQDKKTIWRASTKREKP